MFSELLGFRVSARARKVVFYLLFSDQKYNPAEWTKGAEILALVAWNKQTVEMLKRTFFYL